MSESIKSTLFRFVTLRAPELATEKQRKEFHIHHPNPLAEGHFHALLANPAANQAAALLERANLLGNALQNTEALKAAVGAGFCDFAFWLAKNRSAIFNQKEIVYPAATLTAFGHSTVIVLWDNLFYQMITGKSPALCQQLIEVLVARGYLAAIESPDRHQLAEARVVMPPSFYGGSGQEQNLLTRNAAEVSSTVDEPAIYTGDLKKLAEAVKAQQKLAALRLLQEEMKTAERETQRINLVNFRSASLAHEEAIKTIETSFGRVTSPTLEGEPPPQGPVFPNFQFNPMPELDEDHLSPLLSPESWALFTELNYRGITSLAEAIGKIDEDIRKEAGNAAASGADGAKSILVNNIAIPVNERILPWNQQYSYYILPLYRQMGLYSFLLTLNMGAPGAHAIQTTYHAVLSDGNHTSGAFIETSQGNALTLEFFPLAASCLPIPSGLTDFRIHGNIKLAGGLTLLFDTSVNIFEGGSGIMRAEAASGGGNEDELVIKAPSGYGIKRLGVADYRKVEQSVCCYLPGEVSHIENIMTREYKERSNRRLSRSEDTTTFEKTMEKETQKDSSTTERHELQKEISSVISKDTSFEANTSVHATILGGKVTIDAGASFALNTSREDSNRTAVNYSKEVTENALERVVQKVREERTIRVIEEYEEQNKHGFDNRLGDSHVSGVYRWIDKVYKNQVYNYGNRLMYEFMIPQPATFHNEAIKVLAKSASVTILEKPVDPRTASPEVRMADYSKVDDYTLAYWLSRYNLELPARADETVTVSQAFEMNSNEATGHNFTGAKSFKMELPEGYEAWTAKVGISFEYHPNRDEWAHAYVRVADYYCQVHTAGNPTFSAFFSRPVRKELSVSAQVRDLGGLAINVMAECRRTAEAHRQWQMDCFNAIIEAYKKAQDEYNRALAAATQPTAGVKELNLGFYRQIENMVLRKNCVTYLVGDGNLGGKFYKPGNVEEMQPVVTKSMDSYSAMVKFIEQAFEWEQMSYKFYPFYWGSRSDWHSAYQQEVSDPLFRSFLQAGMARAIVSVRPGFEEAVMYFMATGQIWNGGQVPAIGDDLYLSIVEELKNPTYYIDETWETRVPTTLTAIQSGNISLVGNGLPCECGLETGIVQNTNKLGNDLGWLTGGPGA